MAPGRSRGHLCWWPLIFKIFLISVLSDLLVLMSTGPINHWQVSCLPQPALVVAGLLAHTNKW
jgi:hypothetical protein